MEQTWCLLALLAALMTRARPAPNLGLWPLPLSVEMSPRRLLLAPQQFSIDHDPSSKVGRPCDPLQEAFRR